MQSPGQMIRDARLLNRVSPDDVFKETRIRPVLLERMEEDLLSRLPEDPYCRSLYGSAARAAGAGVAEVLAAYDEIRAARVRASMPPQVAPPPRLEGPRPGQVALGIGAALVLAALIGVGLWLVTRRGSEAEAPRPEAGSGADGAAWVEPQVPAAVIRGIGEVIKARPLAGPGIADTVSVVSPAFPVLPLASDPLPGPGEAMPDSLFVHVLATETVWVRLVQDRRQTRQGVLRPGEEKSWRARREMRFDVGNAAALRVTLNGRPVELPPAATARGLLHFELALDLLAPPEAAGAAAAETTTTLSLTR